MVVICSRLTTDSTTGVRSPAEAKDFSSILCRQLWGPPSLLSNAYRGSIPGKKERPGRDADHSPPSSAEVKNKQETHSFPSPPWRLYGGGGTTLLFILLLLPQVCSDNILKYSLQTPHRRPASSLRTLVVTEKTRAYCPYRAISRRTTPVALT
jgi:hypothetical protein